MLGATCCISALEPRVVLFLTTITTKIKGIKPYYDVTAILSWHSEPWPHKNHNHNRNHNQRRPTKASQARLAVICASRRRVRNVVVAASNARASPLRAANASTTKFRTSATIPLASADGTHRGGKALLARLGHQTPTSTDVNATPRSHSQLLDAHAKTLTVVESLFPSLSIDELSSMSPEQLIAKAKASLKSTSPATIEEEDEDLRVLEPSPESNFTWDEVSDDESQLSRVADDVNGLAVALNPTTQVNASYLGFSSVPTILRVIAHLSPGTRQMLSNSSNAAPLRSPTVFESSPESIGSPYADELVLIDAYFSRVHLVTPMVDEADFRQRHADGDAPENQSSSWLALLNTVLAVGCLASDSSQFSGHNVYYKRALPFLGTSSFGSGHLYTVQALALYGGYILHFLNKPNMATAVTGATMRMAVAMGLHRVQIQQNQPDGLQSPAESSVITRIRTWWSLFCLDTWSATTLGRPGLGYWNPATVLTSPASSLASTDYATISLAASEKFCKIATRVHERLVQLPMITRDEIYQFDRELLTWQSSLHMFLLDREKCPSTLRVARRLLWCRLITTRLTLYRPWLLSAALRRRQWSDVREREHILVLKCIEIARDGIDFIAMHWFQSQISSWNDSWHLFQVSLVLVLAIVSDKAGSKNERCDEYLHKSLDLFREMEYMNPGASRTREILEVLHESANNMDNLEVDQVYDQSGSVLDLLDMELVGDDPDWVAFFCGDD
ncbi:hypothetical protein AK830_g7350 [Neonectria ditissima]|uniref:Xylanolytic transcriptional activator regulatory domain-containing protein n=1 Tax=Neonectria ditissima TaxID=78410 RepID=A0A0P7AZW3_9HYPO|nr:hypothetical protein AK830_g7350 [Neonectria ditissima]